MKTTTPLLSGAVKPGLLMPTLLTLVLLVGCASDGDATSSAASTTQASDTSTGTPSGGDAQHVEITTSSLEFDESEVVEVTLSGDTASADGEGVSVDDSTVNITSPGIYRLTGELADGQVVVDSAEDGLVQLVLAGADITSSTSAPLAVADADEVAVILADATTNHITDAAEYVYPDAETDEPDAALFSTADLTIGGTGSLTVVGNSNDGIASKDGLVIAGGEITVTAVDDGIRGKDYLVVDGGEITVTSGGDALKSDNEEDAGTGFVAVTGGTMAIDAGDDGVHAEADLSISAGTVDIFRSNEGLESADMTISGGTISITASDDGINVAGGDGSGQADAAATGTPDGAVDSAMPPAPGGGGGPGGGGQPPAGVGQGPGGGGQGPGGGGMGGGEAVGDYHLSISGGEVVIDSGGDGLDSNGTAQMSGGTVVVNGPTNDGNAAIDVNGSFDITGGVLLAAGSAGMAETPDATSAQAWLATTFQTEQPTGSVIAIEADGMVLATFTATKALTSLVFSNPDLVSGHSYDVFTGATASGTSVGGLSSGGSTDAAAQVGSVTASDA